MNLKLSMRWCREYQDNSIGMNIDANIQGNHQKHQCLEASLFFTLVIIIVQVCGTKYILCIY